VAITRRRFLQAIGAAVGLVATQQGGLLVPERKLWALDGSMIPTVRTASADWLNQKAQVAAYGPSFAGRPAEPGIYRHDWSADYEPAMNPAHRETVEALAAFEGESWQPAGSEADAPYGLRQATPEERALWEQRDRISKVVADAVRLHIGNTPASAVGRAMVRQTIEDTFKAAAVDSGLVLPTFTVYDESRVDEAAAYFTISADEVHALDAVKVGFQIRYR
jgi:hypothetical protein